MLTIAAMGCAVVAMRTDATLDGFLRARVVTEELIYLPPTQFLDAISLGYRHALANVLWFRTIGYFGRHYRSDRLYPWLAYMCNVVTDLNPQAEHVYRFGGVILPWEANRVAEGIALLEKGTRSIPDSWRLHYMLGFSYYFFRDDLEASSRALRRATELPDAPAYVSQLAAIVDATQHGPEAAIAFLRQLDRSDASDEMRAAIRDRIGALSLARDLDALDDAVQTFRDRFQRLPDDLSEVVRMGILLAIPSEPFGGQYVLDVTSGRVRSSLGHIPARLNSSKMREAFLKGARSGE